MNRFPLRRGRRQIDRDPIVILCVRTVQGFVEHGGVAVSRLRHLDDDDVVAAGWMAVLQVHSPPLSLALIGHLSVGH